MSHNTLLFITFSVCWVFIDKHHILTICPLMWADLFFSQQHTTSFNTQCLDFLILQGHVRCIQHRLVRTTVSKTHAFHGHILKTTVILLCAFIWYGWREISDGVIKGPHYDQKIVLLELTCEFSIQSKSWCTWCRQIGIPTLMGNFLKSFQPLTTLPQATRQLTTVVFSKMEPTIMPAATTSKANPLMRAWRTLKTQHMWL